MVFILRRPGRPVNQPCSSRPPRGAHFKKGSGSNIANSFLKWGKEISAEMVEKGDVVVEHRNKGVNAQGGHVGIATGNKRVNERTGRLEVETISGNHGNKVDTDWDDASTLAVRRSTQAIAKAAIVGKTQDAAGGPFYELSKTFGGLASSNNARPDATSGKGRNDTLADAIRRSVGGGITIPLPDRLRERIGAGDAVRFLQNMPALASPTVTPGEAAQNLPARIAADHTPESLARTVPENPMNRMVGDWKKGPGNNAPALHAPITIHGGNSDPEALANLVQRRIQDSHRTQEHDLDYQSI